MQTWIEEFRKVDAAVVAISVDPPERGAEIVREYGIEFPVLSDQDRRAIEAFGVRHEAGGIDGGAIARPATFIADREGRIVWRDLTENWRVRVRPAQLLEQLERIP